MRKALTFAYVVLLSRPVLAASAAADPAEAARIEAIGAPIRVKLLDEMDAWRRILFESPDSQDAVRVKFAGRLDSLRGKASGQSYPGDLARSRYEFNELIHDALKEFYRDERRAGLVKRGFGDFEDRRRRSVEALAQQAARTRAALAAPTVALATPDGLARLFDGGGATEETKPAVVAGAAAPAPRFPTTLQLLPARRLSIPEPPRVIIPPSVDFTLDPYGAVKDFLARQGASRVVLDVAIQEALRQEMDPLLVLSVIRHESSFDPKATSAVGARGLMQVMPDTGKECGVSPENLYSPSENVKAGICYLKKAWGQFAAVRSTIAAYNAGIDAVVRFDGPPPYKETQNFLGRVLASYKTLQDLVIKRPFGSA